MHIVLNTQDFEYYEALKSGVPLADWSREFVEAKRQKGEGPGDFIEDLLDFLSGGGFLVRELAAL